MSDEPHNRDHRFDVRLEQGLVAEGWFYEMTRGGDRFEVKHDQQASRTGNLYVEYEHDPGRSGTFIPSGIAASEADCWIFVLGEPPHSFLGIATDKLGELARSALKRGRKAEQPYGTCPTHGALVPITAVLATGEVRRAA